MDVVSGDLVAMVNKFEQITTDLMRDLALVLGTGDGQDQAGDQNAWAGGAKAFFEQKKIEWTRQGRADAHRARGGPEARQPGQRELPDRRTAQHRHVDAVLRLLCRLYRSPLPVVAGFVVVVSMERASWQDLTAGGRG
ncbi:hypothetical protein GCM10020219_044700 [Nonomuraea dietziae]